MTGFFRALLFSVDLELSGRRLGSLPRLQLSESDAAGVTSIYYWDPPTTLLEVYLGTYIIPLLLYDHARQRREKTICGGPDNHTYPTFGPAVLKILTYRHDVSIQQLLGPDTTLEQTAHETGRADMTCAEHSTCLIDTLILSASNWRWFHHSRLMPGVWS